MKNNLAVILHEPDIPQNTGNIIRLCANTGVELHLIKPLGWGSMNDSKLRRAGLDYHEYANIVIHENWESCKRYFGNRRILAIETSGVKYHHHVEYLFNDVLLFGSETRGLPADILNEITPDNVIRLPMQESQRSLNLSNTVAIAVYEAWKGIGFIDGV